MTVSDQRNAGITHKIFAIVVTYNGIAWIESCLNSLQSSSYPLDIIVIDNNSTDQTCDVVKTKFPNTLLYENAENIGFGQANNEGLKAALNLGGDYFFLLNQDAYIEADTIEKLIFVMERYPAYGIISPLHFEGTGVEADAGFRQCLINDYGRLADDLFSNNQMDVYPSRFINAAAWMMNKKCLEVVGGFSPLFYHYGEDREYAQRLTYYGLKLGFTTCTKIRHDREGRTFQTRSSNYSRLVWYYGIGSLCRLVDVNNSFIGSWLYTLFWTLRDLAFLTLTGKPVAIIVFVAVLTKMLKSLTQVFRYRRTIKTCQKFLFIT